MVDNEATTEVFKVAGRSRNSMLHLLFSSLPSFIHSFDPGD